MRAKREPERTAVPGGHESPSGAFKPQTGLRSKCRVFSAARSQRFRRAGPDGLRHPASASCLGRHSHPAGRCPNSSSLHPPLAAVVAVANKGLLALDNPKAEVEAQKMLAAALRRVAAPCVCFVPWAALASCRPLPQQLLPASAAGGGRRCCTFFSLLRFRVAAGPSLRPRLVKMCLERPCGCAAMKAPVGLSSRRAVCDSRWKDFVLTSVGAAPNTNIKIIFR